MPVGSEVRSSGFLHAFGIQSSLIEVKALISKYLEILPYLRPKSSKRLFAIS